MHVCMDGCDIKNIYRFPRFSVAHVLHASSLKQNSTKVMDVQWNVCLEYEFTR